MPQPDDDDANDYASGLIVNVHKDWDSLVDSIKHQETFETYEDHISAVMEEVLEPECNSQTLNHHLNAIEYAVAVAPNRPDVLQKFQEFKRGLLELNDHLHQFQGAEFDVLADQFDNYWGYE
jgi:uncharacterized protein (DUF2344 family)